MECATTACSSSFSGQEEIMVGNIDNGRSPMSVAVDILCWPETFVLGHMPDVISSVTTLNISMLRNFANQKSGAPFGGC